MRATGSIPAQSFEGQPRGRDPPLQVEIEAALACCEDGDYEPAAECLSAFRASSVFANDITVDKWRSGIGCNMINLDDFNNPALLALYGKVLDELQRRGVVRSRNNPAADYAESLVARALTLDRTEKSCTGHDAIGPDGMRYEVKCRRLSLGNKSRQLSPIRGVDKFHFDYLAGVLFEPDFGVFKACLIPQHLVLAEARRSEHVNGGIIHLRDSWWSVKGVVDITVELQEVQLIEAG